MVLPDKWGNYPIQEAHPLKQGLKLQKKKRKKNMGMNSRGASTKTRIETWPTQADCRVSPDSRGASTKTRIETGLLVKDCSPRRLIQEAHPLKQGLKPGDDLGGEKIDKSLFLRRNKKRLLKEWI